MKAAGHEGTLLDRYKIPLGKQVAADLGDTLEQALAVSRPEKCEPLARLVIWTQCATVSESSEDQQSLGAVDGELTSLVQNPKW